MHKKTEKQLPLMGANNTYIQNPVFSFVFTINLDGRISTYSILNEMNKNGDLKKLLSDNDDEVFEVKPLSNYYKTKERYFSRLISSGCGNKCLVRCRKEKKSGNLEEKDCIHCNIKCRPYKPIKRKHFGTKKDFVQNLIDKQILEPFDSKKDLVQFVSSIYDKKNLVRKLDRANIFTAQDKENVLQIWDNCIEQCKIKAVSLKNENLAYFVDSDFIEKAVLGCWVLDKHHLVNQKKKIYLADKLHLKEIHKKYEELDEIFLMPLKSKTIINKDSLKGVIDLQSDIIKRIFKQHVISEHLYFDQEIKSKKDLENIIINTHNVDQNVIEVILNLWEQCSNDPILEINKFDNNGKYDIPFSELTNYINPGDKGVSLKLFSNGSISILVELKLEDKDKGEVNILPHNLIKLIQFPNLVVSQFKEHEVINELEDDIHSRIIPKKLFINRGLDEETILNLIKAEIIQSDYKNRDNIYFNNGIKNSIHLNDKLNKCSSIEKQDRENILEIWHNIPKKTSTGILNYIAYEIANNTFNTFFKCLANNKKARRGIENIEFQVRGLDVKTLCAIEIIKRDDLNANHFYFNESVNSGTYLRKLLKERDFQKDKIEDVVAIWKKHYIENKLSLVDYLEIERVYKKQENNEPIDKKTFLSSKDIEKLAKEKIIKNDVSNENYFFFNNIRKNKHLEFLLEHNFSGFEKERILDIWRLYHNRSKPRMFFEYIAMSTMRFMRNYCSGNLTFKLPLQRRLHKMGSFLTESHEYIRIRSRLKNNRYTILKRYLDGKYTSKINGKDFIHISPYVGVMFETPKQLTLDDEYKPNSDSYKSLSRILVAVATQTEEFLKHFNLPYEYLKKNSLTRGSHDAIIVEKRGFVACGIRREIVQELSKDFARKDFLKNPYATLIFSIETIMATLKSVNAFNKELEEYVSPEISNMLRKRKLKYIEVKKFRLLVSKARSLSPCEDYSSNLNIHLRSKIAASGAKRMRGFALDDLVNSVQHRLDNYGHFLKSAQEDLVIRRNLILSWTVLLVAILTLYVRS